uniref:Uncharacterized protein n=2 Tax=Oryza sativa subsp. japonica TaxID=39947 RepID=Q8W3D6_ORYSJ|nr:hypothetical protein [Oryza sativa Japonica Group]AAP54435.1 hypothetical protein LOC_Os10g35340 [Oryza sativa Japonica Group]
MATGKEMSGSMRPERPTNVLPMVDLVDGMSSHNFCQLCSTRRSQLRVSIGGAS